MCDPWESKVFQELMGSVPREYCEKCLPDCKDNIFEARVAGAAFRRCDHTNLGTSPLCDLEAEDLSPSIWSQEARDEFKFKMGSIPEYLTTDSNNQTRLTNQRYYVPDPEKRKTLAFQEQMDEFPTYDAYEKDIAMVNFYFERGNVLQFRRNERMTINDFVSQVGGLAGLSLGFSLVSGAEIIYWCTIRYWRNGAKSSRKKKLSRVGTSTSNK